MLERPSDFMTNQGIKQSIQDNLDKIGILQKKKDNNYLDVKTDFGAKGNGSDDGIVLENAFNYIATHGGRLRIPSGTYLSSKRFKMNYADGVRGNFEIFGDGIDNTIIKFTSVLPSTAGGSEPHLFEVHGTDHNNFLENVTFRDFTIDYSLQEFKGGRPGSLNTTDPNPYYKGARALSIDFAFNPRVENVKIKDVYGDGVTLYMCSFPKVLNCQFFDVGGANIGDSSETGYDNFGGAIGAFSYHGGEISGNYIENKRVFLTDTKVENVTAKNTICGYIGINLEFPQTINNTKPPRTPYSTTVSENESNFKYTDSYGMTVEKNFVRGYTMGIKEEANVLSDIKENTVTHCYMPIVSSTAMAIINENIINYNDVGTCLQSGLAVQQGAIVVFGYQDDTNKREDFNRITDNNIYCEYKTAFVLARSGVFIQGNNVELRGASCFGTPDDLALHGIRFSDNKVLYRDGKQTIRDQNFTNLYGASFKDNYFKNDSSQLVKLIFNSNNNGVVLDTNEFYGQIAVISANAKKIDAVRNTWKVTTNNGVKHDRLLQMDDDDYGQIVGNKFEIGSTQLLSQVASIDGKELIVSDNIVELVNEGSLSFDSIFYSPGGGLRNVQMNRNKILGFENYNIPMFRANSVRGGTFDGNYLSSTGALILAEYSFLGAVYFRNNQARQLLTGTSEPNSLSSIESGVFFPQGQKYDYVFPSANGKEGVVCITSGVFASTSWAAGQTVVSGDFRKNNGNTYKATTSGTTGETAPTHTTGTVSDGTVSWQYVGTTAVFKEYGSILA